MRLEVGKKYLTRGGKIAEVISYDHDQKLYPFNGKIGNENYNCWTREGVWLFGNPNHKKNLTFEILEAAPQQKEAVMKPLFEVGKEYPLRGGQLARILSYHKNQERCYFVETQNSDGTWSISSRLDTGHVYSDCRESSLNLVLPEPEIEISDAVWNAFFINHKGATIKSVLAHKDNAPCTKERLKKVIKAYLAEQKEVGKKDIV